MYQLGETRISTTTRLSGDAKGGAYSGGHAQPTDTAMKFALYRHPRTGNFALVHVPRRFVEGDVLRVQPTEHWFPSREAALGALAELFDRGETAAGD